MKSYTTILLIFAAFAGPAQTSQRPIKIWYGLSVSSKLTDVLAINFGKMYGYNTGPYDQNYSHNSIGLYYRPSKHLSLSAGYMMTNIPKEGKADLKKYRFYGAVSWKKKLEQWRISNAIRLEKHSPNEKKYSYRIIYSFYVRPKSNLIADKIKLTPFFGTRFYYNIGGNPISQYDFEGNKVGKFTPDGWHRLRLRTGFYFKPIKHLKFTIYGIYQEEFNTRTAVKNQRRINVVNPKSGNISRSYRNYFILGISAKYYLPKIGKFMKKKSKKNDR